MSRRRSVQHSLRSLPLKSLFFILFLSLLLSHNHKAMQPPLMTEEKRTLTCLSLAWDTLGVDCAAEDIRKVVRLGQRDRDNTDRNRPVLIEFRQYSAKNQTMEFLYKLKNAPAHLHNLSVTHDLTKNERRNQNKSSRGKREGTK